MTDPEVLFHQEWLGLIQPSEGLVVSIPVLVDAQCMARQSPAVQQALLDLCSVDPETEQRSIRDLPELLAGLLGLTPDLFDSGDALPPELSLYVPEGRQTLVPTLALRKRDAAPSEEASGLSEAETPASLAGGGYGMLVLDLPEGLPLDKAETVTGPWDYPPAAKFDRLLRHVRVPIGLLTNRREVRLIYAPHGESSGSLTFRLNDMASVGGRPLLDAFVMLLSVRRFFSVAREHQLPALLADSRRRQANVTNELAEQVFQALDILLHGFEAAAERDGSNLLNEAARVEDDHLYGGLLTVLLRLVVLLYAEDKGLLPVEHPLYQGHLSVFGLFEQLQNDAGLHPDSMARRFGSWDRLLALFRAVYHGVHHDDLHLPPRRGELFDPDAYSFLEGWSSGSSAPVDPERRAAVRVPSIDDGTIFEVLRKLVFLGGQRLSYSSLDVEQIGSVYERLMGYHVLRVYHPAVCVRPDRVWLTAEEVLEPPASRRARWLQEATGLPKAQAEKLAAAVQAAKSPEEVLAALETVRVKSTTRARPDQLVIQPGEERRRTSSHYTPKSLTAPIVRRTLEPLLAAMGPEPPSELILSLRVCDPAMGSGAFLVEACRFLADQLVAAWTREGRSELVASPHEDVNLHARRLVAQTCLYGVDKNQLAVGLAKLSLWLETMARDLPFTFLDHALRWGDSLVGLTFEQIQGFHWQPTAQIDFATDELTVALEEAIVERRKIQELAADPSPWAQREKEWLLHDAEDALLRVRLIADLIVGAFFAAENDRERQKELGRRLQWVTEWLKAGGREIPAELIVMQNEIRERIPVFHWMIEFPEVFYAERPDPLDGGRLNGAAWMDAFLGNPPFMGQSQISATFGGEYRDWLFMVHPSSRGKSDICPHFFRRSAYLLGQHGAIGLIATNTIAQGDSRRSGLQYLIEKHFEIYIAIRSMAWPGAASVAVAVVHLARGAVKNGLTTRRLDEKEVPTINSRLRPKPERPDPRPLAINETSSFIGFKAYGEGFVLQKAERDALVAKDPRNAQHIFPYLGGEELNSSFSQNSHRYVIFFGDMTENEAHEWPLLMERIDRLVKPERMTKSREVAQAPWWQFWRSRPELRFALGGLPRCLAVSQVTKHLVFAFQPTDRIFTHNLVIFPLSYFTPFAVLQARVHEPWARLLSATMREDLSYTPSDCFQTFPFPHPNPSTVIPSLEDIGQRLYDTRAKFMLDTQQGLTTTYNLLKDPDCHDPRIEELRQLHEEMDRAVLAAYGWDDIPVPPYGTPTTDAERRALEAFEDEVIDRLFVLNAQRAEEEKRQIPAKPVKAATKRGRKAKDDGAQGSLLD
ncbi:MAG TPA: type IIL restriction-modification enzyme MmeI [Thermoanaerobaculia bacterium]|nr:type IIL restriction-modification enzyme MmeI [Thermoanaerobaculia bacterium]